MTQVTLRLLAALYTVATTLTAAVAAPSLPPGDYLEDQFLADLRVSRSPNDAMAKAMDKGIAQSIKLAYRRQGLVFTANWNWHEGATLFTLRADGRIEEGEGWKGGGFDAPAGLDAGGARHFRLTFKHQLLGYTFAGNADQTIAAIAIVGRYRDSHGNAVEFGQNGWVHGSGLAGPFALHNDHVFDPYDFFVLRQNRQRVIAFRWENGRLALYPTHPADGPVWGEPDYDHPITILYPARRDLGPGGGTAAPP